MSKEILKDFAIPFRLSKEESKRLQVENKLAELQQRVLETEKILSKADSLGEQITSKNQVFYNFCDFK